jgi:hypothetical protein
MFRVIDVGDDCIDERRFTDRIFGMECVGE